MRPYVRLSTMAQQTILRGILANMGLSADKSFEVLSTSANGDIIVMGSDGKTAELRAGYYIPALPS